MNCFIKFSIPANTHFNDLKFAFEAFKNKKGIPQSDEFWLSVFPDYALQHFSFLENDIKPRL